MAGPKASWFERGLAAPCVAIAAAALLAPLLPRLVPPLALASHFADDLLLARLAPPAPQNEDIVVIGITDETLARLPCRAPVDRAFLAGLVERLAAAGVRAIGLDILLDAPTTPAADQGLRDQVRQAPIPVVLITAHAATALSEAQRGHLDAFLRGLPYGYANLVKDRLDGAVRWHQPRLDGGVPSFPARIAQALGKEVPEHPFEIAWHGRPDAATPPFPIYPAEAVGFLPKAWLAGKVALVGAVLPDADRHRTPLSVLGRSTSGVEIQAHVLAQLLDGRRHPRLPLFAELALAAVLAALGGLVGASRIPVAFQPLAGFGGLALYGAMAAWAMTGAGLLLPVLGGSLAWIGGMAAVTGLSLWRERTERRTLMGLFARHVSAPLAEEIWRQRATFMAGGRPKPLELTATVLFSDIEDFTPVSERLGPVALMAWLEAYMERMTAIVAAHHGLVLRFIGDALLAVYGVPVARTSAAEIAADAVAAARSALAMASSVSALNAELADKGLPPVRVRIGIHTGTLVAGSLGGAGHLEYALVGDTANTAARLEALGKSLRGPDSGPCIIALGEPTRAMLPESFALRDVGEVALKGKRQRVRAYELLGERNGALDRS
jgi:class 3 adenylate cyclase/CHASE2 domain-containing sensor protein